MGIISDSNNGYNNDWNQTYHDDDYKMIVIDVMQKSS